MLDVVLSNRFKKDLKLAAKRGLDLDALNAIVDQLAAGQPLPDKNRDHALTGDYIGFRECHIRPDWLLVYRVDGEDLNPALPAQDRGQVQGVLHPVYLLYGARGRRRGHGSGL